MHKKQPVWFQRGQTPTQEKVPEQNEKVSVAPAPSLAWVSDPFYNHLTMLRSSTSISEKLHSLQVSVAQQAPPIKPMEAFTETKTDECPQVISEVVFRGQQALNEIQARVNTATREYQISITIHPTRPLNDIHFHPIHEADFKASIIPTKDFIAAHNIQLEKPGCKVLSDDRGETVTIFEKGNKPKQSKMKKEEYLTQYGSCDKNTLKELIILRLNTMISELKSLPNRSPAMVGMIAT